MKLLLAPILLLLIVMVLACRSDNGDPDSIKNRPLPYVLKANEGEILMGDSAFIAKVSPEMGSQSEITIVTKIPAGKATGIHYHQNEDEIFHQEFNIDKKPLTLEALNVISKKYDTYYKTVN